MTAPGSRSRRQTSSRLSETLVVLSDALAELAAERSLNSVLQRIADLAREVVGARYAALGVADTDGRIVEFITSGLTPQARAAIGPLPRGHGLLGVLIREGRPVRIPEIDRDPRSSGFPPNHPPMTSLLGVPIVLNDRVLGDLYLTDKLEASEFDEDDERLAMLLARHAGVAIENAHLNDELERRLEQVSSLRELGQAIGQELDVERTLQVVVERSAELLSAALVAIALKDPNGDAYTFEAAAGRRARRLLGLRVSRPVQHDRLGGRGRARRARRRRRARRARQPARPRGGRRTDGPLGAAPDRQSDRRLHHGVRSARRRAVHRGRPPPRRGDRAAGRRRHRERPPLRAARHEASTSQALLRVTRAMNASIRLEEILQLIVDSLSELIGTPAVAVSLLAADGVHFEVAATRALTAAGRPRRDVVARTDTTIVPDGQRRPPGQPIPSAERTPAARQQAWRSLVIGGEGPSVVADTRDRPDLVFPTLRDGSTPRSVAISPIRLSERVLGVVEAYSTEPNHFSEDDTALLAAFADQAATAIETARLFGQARELALLQERDRIAKELHDGIIQTIYAVGLNLDYCRLTLHENPDDVEARLGDATAGLNRAISDIRNYILNLTHRVGGVVGLREAAEAARPRVRAIRRPRASLPVSIAVADRRRRVHRRPGERRIELVQVLREALANAVRHARPTHVTVAGHIDGGRLVLSVVRRRHRLRHVGRLDRGASRPAEHGQPRPPARRPPRHRERARPRHHHHASSSRSRLEPPSLCTAADVPSKVRTSVTAAAVRPTVLFSETPRRCSCIIVDVQDTRRRIRTC